MINITNVAAACCHNAIQEAFIPTSMTTAPGLIQSPRTRPGRPAQEIKMSARRTCS